MTITIVADEPAFALAPADLVPDRARPADETTACRGPFSAVERPPRFDVLWPLAAVWPVQQSRCGPSGYAWTSCWGAVAVWVGDPAPAAGATPTTPATRTTAQRIVDARRGCLI